MTTTTTNTTSSAQPIFNIKSQLPPGVQVLANCQGWFNGADGRKHLAGVCQSDDPRTVHNQVLTAHSVGIDGFVVDWYGATPDYASPTDRFTQLLFQETAKLGMTVSIMVDSGTFKWSSLDHKSVLNSALSYVRQKYLPLPNYTAVNNKPLLWEFGWAEHGINIPVVAKANPDLALMTQSRMAGGDGTYGWVNGFPPSSPQQYVHRYLAQNDPIQVPCIFDGFDDHNPDPAHIHESRWGGAARSIPYGQWQMCLDEINAVWSSGKRFGAVQICTWNDYDERTEMESRFLALSGLKLY